MLLQSIFVHIPVRECDSRQSPRCSKGNGFAPVLRNRLHGQATPDEREAGGRRGTINKYRYGGGRTWGRANTAAARAPTLGRDGVRTVQGGSAGEGSPRDLASVCWPVRHGEGGTSQRVADA